ncbi:MAG: hypothetical protein CVV61_06945 [Tenericutes bacterium HGW-Tenericutes-6]|jgi:hypothetical protein|nr:MAG: hypothetical protein CVV61_06945 [Tenericutes bacterium HGW-Tenericutes-6]
MSIQKLILWTPRTLAIIFNLFLFMFSFDVFLMDDVWYMLLLGFIMHNIPFIILTILLVMAFKYPLVGAISYIGAGIFYAIWMLTFDPIMIEAIFAQGFPAILIGALFFLSYYNSRIFNKHKP